jgi:SAM-dependent methyltransferase
MLELAEVTKDDLVYDLGSGDGRIVNLAAERYGVRGVGVEIDPQLVWFSRRSAKRKRVDHLVRFLNEDALTVDISPATVITLYLSPAANLLLRTKLQRQLRPGARVVSHTHDMADWVPDRVERVRARSGEEHILYLWRISKEGGDCSGGRSAVCGVRSGWREEEEMSLSVGRFGSSSSCGDGRRTEAIWSPVSRASIDGEVARPEDHIVTERPSKRNCSRTWSCARATSQQRSRDAHVRPPSSVPTHSLRG